MDYVLRGADVIDGTGSDRIEADVVVRDDVIAEIGNVVVRRDAEQIDVGGLTLAPGFIDVHTHLDAQVLWDPELAPSPWHGVTTAIMGNCGFGIAPTRPEDRELIIRTFENAEAIPAAALEAGISWSFESFPEYLDAVEALPKRINVAALLGHTPLRYYVMGLEASERAATADELAAMAVLVREALAAGAVGFATSRNDVHYGAWGMPIPSRLADLEELTTLAALLDDAGHGVLTVAAGKSFSLPEIAGLARQLRQPVSWESVFTGYDARDNFGSAPAGTAYALVEESAELGDNLWPQISCRPVVLQVTLEDPYPLISYSQAFREVTAARGDERLALYRSADWRARARAGLGDRADIMWSRLSVQESTANTDALGATIKQLSEVRGLDPLDVFIDVALADDLKTRFRMVLMNDDEDELADILRHDKTLLAGSDAGAHLSQLCDSCFPSYLIEYWVREQKVLSLEDAVWRMTGHPASVFGLTGRGTIAVGNVADLVAFDPERTGVEPMKRIHDLPGGADRVIIENRGIEHVWVAGVPIRRHGSDVVGAYPGRLVRGRKD